MTECTLAQTGERLTRLGHALNRIRRQLRRVGLLEEAESIRVAARECWRAGRLIERKPAASDIYLRHPKDDDDLDDDALDAELDRLFLAD
jgi:hypothetical protein